MVLDGERIDLTPLEFGVLRLLIDREGRAVRRHALLEDVWGYDHAAAGSNVLEVVVRSLRRKLGAHGRRIETVRGLGYRWRT
jgi:DNA-binding response OmpR family regulator